MNLSFDRSHHKKEWMLLMAEDTYTLVSNHLNVQLTIPGSIQKFGIYSTNRKGDARHNVRFQGAVLYRSKYGRP